MARIRNNGRGGANQPLAGPPLRGSDGVFVFESGVADDSKSSDQRRRPGRRERQPGVRRTGARMSRRDQHVSVGLQDLMDRVSAYDDTRSMKQREVCIDLVEPVVSEQQPCDTQFAAQDDSVYVDIDGIHESLYNDIRLRLEVSMVGWSYWWSGPDPKTVDRIARSLPNLALAHKIKPGNGSADLVTRTFRKACEDLDPLTNSRTFRKFFLRRLFVSLAYYVMPLLLVAVAFLMFFSRHFRIGAVFALALFPLFLLRVRKRFVHRKCEIVDHCCHQTVELPESFSGSFYGSETVVCQPKTYNGFFTIAIDSVWVPRNCSHNLEVAIKCRQLLPAIGSHESRVLACEQAFKAFKPVLPLLDTVDEYEAHVAYEKHLTGSKLISYKDYRRNMNLYHSKSGNRSKVFVKVEVLMGKELRKRHPRLISGKEDYYLHCTGPMYYAYQKALVARLWPDDLEQLMNLSFVYPSSLSPKTLGLLVSQYEQMGWHAYEADFSRLDGHTEEEILMLELVLYETMGYPRQLLELLGQQLTTKGSSALGHGFTCRGKRASGVINTTMGNTLTCMALAAGALKQQGFLGGVKDAVIIQLGDDNVLFTHPDKPLDTTKYCGFMTNAGHKLEMIDRGVGQDGFDKLEFCSSLFWDIGEHRVLGPKVGRALAKSWMPSKHIKDLSQHAYGVALGYQHYMWIPVLGYVCRRILASNRSVNKPVFDANPYKLRLTDPIIVDPDSVERHFIVRYSNYPSSFEDALSSHDFSRPGVHSSDVFDLMAEIDGVSCIFD